MSSATSTSDRLRAEWKDRISKSGISISVRPMNEDERSFVWETTAKVRWPRSGHEQFSWQEWRDIYGPTVDFEMANGHVFVADYDNIVLGYIIMRNDGVTSMLYVKKDFRGIGVGLMLLDLADVKLPVAVSAPTFCWDKWCKRHGIPWHRLEMKQSRKSKEIET